MSSSLATLVSVFTGSYTHVAGDHFYFKGGVDCNAATLGIQGILIIHGGSTGAQDYYGPDPGHAWFTGASWSQPVFDGNGTRLFTVDSWTGSNNCCNNFTVDQIFFTGLYWSQNNCCVSYVAEGEGTGIQVTNGTFTGWSHAPYNSGATLDVFQAISGQTGTPFNSGSVITGNKFYQDANLANSDSGTAVGSALGTVEYNECYHMHSCIIGNGANTLIAFNSLHDLIQYDFDPTDHGDVIFPFGPAVIHDNLIWNIPGNQEIFFPQCPANATHIYNNMVYNSTVNNMITFDQSFSWGTQPCYAVNNTLITNSSFTVACVRVENHTGGAHSYGTVVIENNYCVSEGSTSQDVLVDPNLTIASYTGITNPAGGSVTVTSFISGPETIMTHATATADGYTASQAYAYSPTSAGSPTVGHGANLTSLCGAMPGLCSDTTYGIAERTQLPRPPSGNWDAGAYQFTVPMLHPKLPPLNLILSAH